MSYKPLINSRQPDCVCKSGSKTENLSPVTATLWKYTDPLPTQGILLPGTPRLTSAVREWGISTAWLGYYATSKLRKYSYPPCTLVILTKRSPAVPWSLGRPWRLPGDVSSPAPGRGV